MNTSTVSDRKTAHTNIDCAKQRAENLFVLGSRNVIELCCGPSLRILQWCYESMSISVTGNDIDERWKDYYPQGKWLMGDCFSIDCSSFDTIVFAPPLSKGCTGKREDSLSISEVTPSYYDFLNWALKYPKALKVLVLPARSIVLGKDNNEFHMLLDRINIMGSNYDIDILKSGERYVRKYVDVYYK